MPDRPYQCSAGLGTEPVLCHSSFSHLSCRGAGTGSAALALNTDEVYTVSAPEFFEDATCPSHAEHKQSKSRRIMATAAIAEVVTV